MSKWLELARSRMSASRLIHVQGVVQTASKLALRYGADPEQAELAGWLHDIFRECDEKELRQLAQKCNFVLPASDVITWHGPICAARMASDFGIADPAIAEAVAYHTVGHPEMPLLARIIYVADAIEPSRDYAQVAALRECAWQNLSIAVARCADDGIAHLLAKHVTISLETVQMRNNMYDEVRAFERLRL